MVFFLAEGRDHLVSGGGHGGVSDWTRWWEVVTVVGLAWGLLLFGWSCWSHAGQHVGTVWLHQGHSSSSRSHAQPNTLRP